MDLTSYERLRRYLVGQGETSALTNNEAARRDILRWIAPVSAAVEAYCARTFETTSYTEYHDLAYGQREFFVEAFPATTLTSVYLDTSGLWDGSESEITDCYIGVNGRTVVIPSTLESEGPKYIRIIYTGGLGASGTRSVFTVSSSTGTWTVGSYVRGSTSDALGIVRATTVAAGAGTLTVEVLYGVFSASETLSEYDSESAQGSSDGSATLASKTTTAICEAYPEITLATEMQIRYLYRNKWEYENSGTQRDGTTQRTVPMLASVESPLRPEVMALLQKHRRILV